MFEKKIEVGNEELRPTCFNISCTKNGVPTSCSIEYNLIGLARQLKPYLHDKHELCTQLSKECYGSLFTRTSLDRIMTPQTEHRVFDPIEVVLRSLNNCGI